MLQRLEIVYTIALKTFSLTYVTRFYVFVRLLSLFFRCENVPIAYLTITTHRYIAKLYSD